MNEHSHALAHDLAASLAPGKTVRALRKSQGLTLSALGARTGLTVSTLSKIESGRASLSYDKLMLLSKGLGVDPARLLDAKHAGTSARNTGATRRVVLRAGEGSLVETQSYRQQYVATELLSKSMTPIFVELRARTIDEFVAEFGGFIRHPGEEFTVVLAGTAEFHSDTYAPVRLGVGDSIYFDSEMGHAYLKASDEPCHLVSIVSPRSGSDDHMVETFVNASERLNAQVCPAEPTGAMPVRRARRQ